MRFSCAVCFCRVTNAAGAQAVVHTDGVLFDSVPLIFRWVKFGHPLREAELSDTVPFKEYAFQNVTDRVRVVWEVEEDAMIVSCSVTARDNTTGLLLAENLLHFTDETQSANLTKRFEYILSGLALTENSTVVAEVDCKDFAGFLRRLTSSYTLLVCT